MPAIDRRLFLAGALASSACATAAPPAAGDTSAEAADLYRRAMVFDANLSPPFQKTFPLPQSAIDLVRQSGVTAVKTSLGGYDNDFTSTIEGVASWQRLFDEAPDVFLQIRNHADFARAKDTGRLGVVLSFEATTMIGDNLDRIRIFRGLGVRLMQLSYNQSSPFGMGVLGDAQSGLTERGREAVAVMNTNGVAIDLSHCNEKTSFDAIAASTTSPLITHAGCAAVHPHPRNKSDALLRAIADRGGVIGIFGLPYLAPSPRQPTLDDVIAHLSHALQACGEDHVGIGTDSSMAARNTSPEAAAAFQKGEEARRQAGLAAPEDDGRLHYVVGLNTPRRMELIADALLRRGHSSRIVEKVLGRNFTDALGRAWAK